MINSIVTNIRVGNHICLFHLMGISCAKVYLFDYFYLDYIFNCYWSFMINSYFGANFSIERGKKVKENVDSVGEERDMEVDCEQDP